MEIFYIVLLVFFGLLFLVAELVLLPGVSIGALLALVCYGSSVYLAFRDFGTGAGILVIVIILALSLVVTVISLRAKTWQCFSLKQEIRSSSTPLLPSEELKVGDRGVTSRASRPWARSRSADAPTRPSRSEPMSIRSAMSRSWASRISALSSKLSNNNTTLWIYRQE